MIKTLREKIAFWLCREMVNNLYISANAWEMKMNEVGRLHQAAEERKASLFRADRKAYIDDLSVVDLVREKLVGFSTKMVDGVKLALNPQGHGIDVISNIFDDAKSAGYSGENDFLADVKRISDLKAFRVIVDYVKRNQIIFTTGAAKSMEQVNFGGATINGAELIREEVQALAALFEERNKKEEAYDKHEAM